MSWQSPSVTVGVILFAMTALAAVETAIPLRATLRRKHLIPNLALTFLTFATNAVFNAMLVSTLAMLEPRGFGLLPLIGASSLPAAVAAVLVLDLSFYVCHRAMHEAPSLWLFHRVHHSDPAVDVTTTIRQHPGEGVIRYVFLAAFAIPLGASPTAFAAYRLASALSGLLEHANVQLPRRFDEVVSLVFTWANFHKVHHSRLAHQTNSNFGNLVSLWDRLFGTHTPAAVGATIDYGLDGFDEPATQSTRGLLLLPFRRLESNGSELPRRQDRMNFTNAPVTVDLAAEHDSWRHLGPKRVGLDD